MGWLVEQWGQFCFSGSLIVIAIALGRWAVNEPRAFTRQLCGSLAWFFAIMAMLWMAHLSDKYL